MLADEIRAGCLKDVENMLSDIETQLLDCKLQMSLELHTVKYVTIGPMLQNSDMYEVPKKQYETVELNFTPFHLAIMSRRAECVRLFLEKIVDLKEEKPELLYQVLEKEVEIDYGCLPQNLFDKDDRSLDGMNAIHLAARFDSLSMVEISEILKDHMSDKLTSKLVNQQTNHLALTPLHLAVQRSQSTASSTRYNHGNFYFVVDSFIITY